MLQIAHDIGERFEAAMQSASIAEHLRPHFRRWLRFYLDFCAKYGFDANAGSSFRNFNAKLREKGQDEWKRKQAHEAVALYIHEVVGNCTDPKVPRIEGGQQATNSSHRAPTITDSLDEKRKTEMVSSLADPVSGEVSRELSMRRADAKHHSEEAFSHQLMGGSETGGDRLSTSDGVQYGNRRISVPHIEGLGSRGAGVSSRIVALQDPRVGPLRIGFAGALYHLTALGDRREAIYEDDADRQSFLDVLPEGGTLQLGVPHLLLGDQSLPVGGGGH